jgi:hypothetical protein
MSISTIAFPIVSPEPIDLNIPIRHPVDWSENPSKALRSQIMNNFADLVQLKVQCEPEMKILVTLDNEMEVIKNYYVSRKQKQEDCERFSKRVGSYFETIERDQEVFEASDWNVTTYAVVLFYEDVYYGHIYCWISPTNPEYCFAMGIRNRIDSSFIQSDLKNVSMYLLEGVRRFALSKGCSYIAITHPVETMINILKKAGFETTPYYDLELKGRDRIITLESMGRSLGGQYKYFAENNQICPNCLEYKITDRTFVEELVSFRNVIY